MPIVTFSIPQSTFETLKNQALSEDESANLIAKRLLLSLLEPTESLTLDETSKILDRLEKLEATLDDKLYDNLDSKLEEKIPQSKHWIALEKEINELKDSFQELVGQLSSNLSSDEEEKGLNDGQLSEKLSAMGRGVSNTTVNRWRKGQRKPSGKNENIFQEFEIRGDRWFPIKHK
ncbi:MAG: hypothetical protein AB4060_11100 [Crocosphaera sp.]